MYHESTSRLLDTEAGDDDGNRIRDKAILTYKFSHPEVNKFFFERLDDLRPTDYILNEKEIPIFNIKIITKWLFESYYELINDHYISDQILYDFRKKLKETIADGENFSKAKFEIFTKKRGLKQALTELLSNILKNNSYSKAILEVEQKPVMTNTIKSSTFTSLIELFEKNSISLRENYQALLNKKIDKLETRILGLKKSFNKLRGKRLFEISKVNSYE